MGCFKEHLCTNEGWYILGKPYLTLNTPGVLWIHLLRVSVAWRLIIIRFRNQTTCIQNMFLPFAGCNFGQVDLSMFKFLHLYSVRCWINVG